MRNESFTKYLSGLVNSSLEVLNKTCDDILNDIRIDHYFKMEGLDREDEHLQSRIFIPESLAPHDNISAWWDALPKEQKTEWNEGYEEVQFGSSGGEGIENPFFWYVFNFLREKSHRLKTELVLRQSSEIL